MCTNEYGTVIWEWFIYTHYWWNAVLRVDFDNIFNTLEVLTIVATKNQLTNGISSSLPSSVFVVLIEILSGEIVSDLTSLFTATHEPGAVLRGDASMPFSFFTLSLACFSFAPLWRCFELLLELVLLVDDSLCLLLELLPSLDLDPESLCFDDELLWCLCSPCLEWSPLLLLCFELCFCSLLCLWCDLDECDELERSFEWLFDGELECSFFTDELLESRFDGSELESFFDGSWFTLLDTGDELCLTTAPLPEVAPSPISMLCADSAWNKHLLYNKQITFHQHHNLPIHLVTCWHSWRSLHKFHYPFLALRKVNTIRIAIKFGIWEYWDKQPTNRLWCEIVNHSKLTKVITPSFYRPQPNDNVSIEKLNQSLRRLNRNSKSIIINYCEWRFQPRPHWLDVLKHYPRKAKC